MNFIERLYSERLEEREGFLQSLIVDYNNKGNDFYKEIHLKEETFKKHFREGKFSLNTIVQISKILHINKQERGFIFFGETKHEKKLDSITRRLQEELQTIPTEEREDFFEELQRRIQILEECSLDE